MANTTPLIIEHANGSGVTGNVYDFNTAEKLNQLLIKLLLATGQLTEGGAYDVDFDHQFLEADKYDSKRTYKGFDGYSPGVFTIGGLFNFHHFFKCVRMHNLDIFVNSMCHRKIIFKQVSTL